jgi:hypothetical protein
MIFIPLTFSSEPDGFAEWRLIPTASPRRIQKAKAYAATCLRTRRSPAISRLEGWEPQHGDDLGPERHGRAGRGRRDLAEEARAARPHPEKQAHGQNDGEAGSREPGCKQRKVEREPVRMAAERGGVGERRQQETDRSDGADCNRQGARVGQAMRVHGRGELRAPEQAAPWTIRAGRMKKEPEESRLSTGS